MLKKIACTGRSLSLVSVIRALLLNGIGKKQFSARSGPTAKGIEWYRKYSPNPRPKKSPRGASTLGFDSPSQYIRKTSAFNSSPLSFVSVIQIWVISAGPESSS